MIVTQKDAHQILAHHYGAMPVKLTTRCVIGVRTSGEAKLGLPILAWRKLQPGPLSMVQIGRVLANGDVDWHWTEATTTIQEAAP